MRLRMMIVLVIVLGMAFSAQAQDGLLSQWGSYADATSEYGADAYSAMQATGRPNTKGCVDEATAWASATVSNSDALTVFYDEAVFATEINIHQNYSPGAIVAVELISADGTQVLSVPNSSDMSTDCPSIFSLAVPELGVPVFAVRIWLEQSLIGNWNEIDAVELVGRAANVPTVNPANVPPATQQADGSPVKNPPNTVDGPSGQVVTCDTGGNFENGVSVTVVQMRSGYNYTATAVGLNGFDPVLAVLDSSGTGLCADDDIDAANYSANLPTTGQVNPSPTSSQVPFANTSNSAFADISLVTGGYDSQAGEFLLILEGMTFSSADNAGDAFSVEITPSVANSNVNVTAYVISVTNVYDPTVGLIDTNYDYLVDNSGNIVGCDDAGNPSLCWGDSASLSGSYISRTQNRQLPGGPYDAMLSVPVVPDDAGGYYNFIVNSAQGTYGDYVMVFHIGITE